MTVAVYRLYDETERLLYVGCSSGWTHRLADHRRTKEWWPQVADVTVPYHKYRVYPRAEVERIIAEKAS